MTDNLTPERYIRPAGAPRHDANVFQEAGLNYRPCLLLRLAVWNRQLEDFQSRSRAKSALLLGVPVALVQSAVIGALIFNPLLGGCVAGAGVGMP